MRVTRFRAALTGVAVIAGSVTGLALSAPAANADSRYNCGDNPPAGMFSMFYDSKAYGYGAEADFCGSIPNFAGYTFNNTAYGTAGEGKSVKNNASAMEVTDETSEYRVYYNSWYGGPYQTIHSYDGDPAVDLASQLKNNDASAKYLGND
ncbi:hypothetical protein K7472_07455 [Streptomyces sp. PTM05]|uniref:Peptidase inhibitor family I36 n=1 Tax=Streptantibioticus parmotrematis TaxID=2873249 RepID=A0ABS7QNF8_9ACTN|nr:hypothetical protein [Streptantibioticus parmotrematis]MBY8884680.1 hypothetical protein [Streptantibioticus parmotrematis]